ncbi:MAG: M48 family metallopeptidase [Cyanobacteria bacterium J06627_28]
MKYVPKEITEEVNITPVHPLVNLAYLIGTVSLGILIIYALLGLVAGQLVNRIGPKKEEQIGALLVQGLPFETIENDSRVDYLNELAASLQADVAQTPAGPATYPDLKVKILDTPLENAMVTAGSYLFITDGLLNEVQSENELAFVMAHEMGHLHHRDPLNALGRSLVWVTILSLLGFSPSQNSVVVPNNAFNLAELSHSRGQETDADDYAIALIMARYGHGAHSLDFFKRMQLKELDLGLFNTVTEWQQTHPLSSARVERLETMFEENDWAVAGEAIALPENIGCKNFSDCQ